MTDAKKSLHINLDIGAVKYKFDKDVFDLDHVNLPLLSDQISKIPGHVGFIVEAVGEAEKYLASMESKFEMWIALQTTRFYSDLKTEKAKLQQLIVEHADDYTKFETAVQEAKKIAYILKAYQKGIDAKLQLAQTLSANIRVEKDANIRNYDKGSTKGNI